MFKGTLCLKMSTNDKNNIEPFPNCNDDNNPPIKDKNILRRMFKNPDKMWNILNGSLAAAVIVAIFGGLWNFHTLKDDITLLRNEDIALLKKDIFVLSDKFDKEYLDLNSQIDKFEDNYTEINIEFGVLKNMYNFYNISATESFQNSVINLCKKDGVTNVNNAIWSDSEVIATDGNEKYTAEELSQKKLLLSYIQNEQEVYFYGQYSKNNKWDGDCIINIYYNNNLIFATEASYNDGILEKYQQLYTFTTTAHEEVWCISKREYTENGNTGNSWNYFKDQDIIKKFNLDNVEQSNIYSVEELKKIIRDEYQSPIEAFYHGTTLNGKYNDNNENKSETERSYLVKFSKDDSTVRMLYVGNFVNGELQDYTGDAWYIVRNDKKIGSEYMWYKGNFDNNTSIDETTKENFKNNLTEDEIKEIILPYFFKCEMRWYGFDVL